MPDRLPVLFTSVDLARALAGHFLVRFAEIQDQVPPPTDCYVTFDDLTSVPEIHLVASGAIEMCVDAGYKITTAVTVEGKDFGNSCLFMTHKDGPIISVIMTTVLEKIRITVNVLSTHRPGQGAS